MTIYIIEADGEVIAETGCQSIAEAMYDAAREVYDTVIMHIEQGAEAVH